MFMYIFLSCRIFREIFIYNFEIPTNAAQLLQIYRWIRSLIQSPLKYFLINNENGRFLTPILYKFTSSVNMSSMPTRNWSRFP